MYRTRHQVIAAALLPIFLGFCVYTSKPAHAWKPNTHALTANLAIHDTLDGAMCLPGVSEDQIPFGTTEIMGSYYDQRYGWRTFNDLRVLARYVRAGTLGPDAFPDSISGQLQTHVDWSRIQRPQDEIRLGGAAEYFLGDLARLVVAPIQNATPPWRSIDWGHEVLKEALNLYKPELDGHLRDTILQDPHKKKLYWERQASIAFALGYLMHMSGDSFAHAWINDWTKQPFSYFTGRAALPELGPLAPTVEELQHMAIEKYVQAKFVPELADTCKPVDPSFYQDTTSVCDPPEDKPFVIDCDYCNPLRAVDGPTKAPLSDTCDHCFAGCNPWREVCPPKVNEGLPCAQCDKRDSYYQNCFAKTMNAKFCEQQTAVYCANVAKSQCCGQLVDVLERAKVLSATEAAKYTCESGTVMPDDIYTQIGKARQETWNRMPAATQAELAPFSPHGCFQGSLRQELAADQSLGTVLGEPVTLQAGEQGAFTDFNSDGKKDLVNECMMWNCLLSPGTSQCPLNALIQDLPASFQAGSLECEVADIAQLINNPDPLLGATEVAVPRHFYKKAFLERRFPADRDVGSLGTWSIGGFIPNGVYAVTDTLKVFSNALDAISQPLLMVVDRCALGGDANSAECVLAAKIAAIKFALLVGIKVLTAIGGVVSGIPFVGPVLAAVFFATAAVVAVALALVELGVVPGLTLPLEGMRSKLLRLLEDKWLSTVMNTAESMSGTSCTSTCGGNIPNCDEHHFLGLHAYFDWALEAYGAVTDFKCEENNYITRMVNGDLRVRDWINVIRTGLTIIVTQYLGCKVLDYFYKNTLRESLRTVMRDKVLDVAAQNICSLATIQFWDLPELLSVRLRTDGSQWESSCQSAIKAYYGTLEDPIAIVRALRELLAALDNGGLTDAQKTVLFPRIEAALRARGINVDLASLDSTAQALDCSVSVGVDFRLSVREQVVEAFRLAFGEQAAAMVDRLAQQMGRYEDVLEIKKFAPLYNTIQLNKLILMGTGEPACARWERRCNEGDTMACAEMYACKKYPTPAMKPAGLLGLAAAANANVLSPAFQGAYSRDPLDENPPTYLGTFFQESFVEPGAYQHCSQIDFNVMCNSLYSIDDPDDYCRDLELWSPGKLAELQSVGHAPGGVINECAEALNLVDEYAETHGLLPYAPTDRRLLGPGSDPHLDYSYPLADGDHRGAYSHRSTVMSRAVAQGTGGTFPDPMTSSSSAYYPHDLRRFTLANKDSHVPQLYARIFAPYYCPGSAQTDRDCDAIPDGCDICPDTYNPDQYDANWDGIGDDCVGYDPVTGVTPENRVWRACSQAAADQAEEAGQLDNVSAGLYHTCVADWFGAPKCWGYNYSGQASPPSGDLSSVSAGAYHTCATRTDGTLTCWGSNTDGRSTPPTGQFVQLSSGNVHTCALKSDGRLACWGTSGYGRTIPPANAYFTSVTSGTNHTCGLQTDNTVRCWGSNYYGQSNVPAGEFKQIDAGSMHNCGIRGNGSIACWGSNGNNRSTPPQGSFRQVSAGTAHSCAIRTDGTLACWGYNYYGQAAPPSGTFVQISAGGYHTCAKKDSGQIMCWGRNNYGQTDVPIWIPPLTPIYELPAFRPLPSIPGL